MAKFLDALTPQLIEFVERQPLFFVATAPRSDDARINLSPKGMDTFRVLSPDRVGYLDLTGSGNETSAHLHENGRVTFMFCSFDRAPNILRLYGRGRVVLRDSEEWPEVSAHFELLPGARQIILAEVESVQTSCGFAVPFMEVVGERETLLRSAEKKGDEGLQTYWRQKNTHSIDGIAVPIPVLDDLEPGAPEAPATADARTTAGEHAEPAREAESELVGGVG